MRSDYSNTDAIIGVGEIKSVNAARENFYASRDIFPAKVVTLKDPYRSGNIGVKITGIHAEDVSASDCLFAPMLMPFGGGDNYGFFSMPPVGSDVMVTFIDGDLKNPIILGAWQSRKKIVKSFSSQNPIEGALGSTSKYRALNTGDLDSNAQPLLDNKQEFSLNKLTDDAKSAINGFASGELSDLIKGYVGQIPGMNDVMSNFGISADGVTGAVLSQVVDQLANAAAAVPADSLLPNIVVGKAQVATLVSQLSTITSTLATLTSIATIAMNGAPGLIALGLSTLKSDLLAGVLGQSLTDALNSVNPDVKNAILKNVDTVVASGLGSTTAFSSIASSLDNVLKSTNLCNQITSGVISETPALKALANNNLDWLLGTDPAQVYVYGPQCPLAYRNQNPARTLEEVGENVSEDTTEGKQEIDSNYMSQDVESSGNSSISPEPRSYIWKSPKGSAIEIDDTGFSESGRGMDNRGIRLTTKKGALIHIVDEKDNECILIRDKNNNYIWIDTVKNDMHIVVHDDMTETVHHNKANITRNNVREITGGEHTEHVNKDKKETIDKDKHSNVGGNRVEQVGGTYSISVKGTCTIFAEKDVKISSAQKVLLGSELKTTIESFTEIKLKAPIISFESM